MAGLRGDYNEDEEEGETVYTCTVRGQRRWINGMLMTIVKRGVFVLLGYTAAQGALGGRGSRAG